MTRKGASIVSPEDARDMGELLVSGGTTSSVGKVYGVSSSTVAAAVMMMGYVYEGHAGHGNWIRKQETTTMNGQTSDEWNMATDDYNALLAPEREPTVETVDVANPPAMPLLTSDDEDLQAAARLLDKAADVRRIDVALITDLQARVDEMMLKIGSATLSAQNEHDRYEQQIGQLQTENKRLNEKIKVEISRGFLRQSMDNLRKVLE